MTCCGVGQAEPSPTRGTKAVEPIAGNIYADHGCCWYHITLSLPYISRSRKTGRRQLFETVKRGRISLLVIVVMPQGVQHCSLPHRDSWPGAAMGLM